HARRRLRGRDPRRGDGEAVVGARRPRGAARRRRLGVARAAGRRAGDPLLGARNGLAGPAAVVRVEELDLVLVPRAVGLVAEGKGQPDVLQLTPREVALDRLRLDAVDARTIQAEDLRLDLGRQRRVAVPLLEPAADLERPKRLDLILR